MLKCRYSNLPTISKTPHIHFFGFCYLALIIIADLNLAFSDQRKCLAGTYCVLFILLFVKSILNFFPLLPTIEGTHHNLASSSSTLIFAYRGFLFTIV